MVAHWPLIGRREELSIIERTLGEDQCRGLLLAGAPGVGKTRLAREALAAADAAGCETKWAVASRAAAVIPFGAVAHLLPPAEEKSTHLQLLQQAGQWLAERADGRRVVLGIDDAHMLDDASAALLLHLVINGIAFVVATLLTGAPAPGPVTALWKEGIAERLEIQALARYEVSQLIEAALGGPVDGLTRERLWQLSRGNILYLRELVRGGRQTGDLACSEGMWRWAGPVSAPPQLVELIQARIGALPPALWNLGELVAFGEPLAFSVLARVGISAGEVEAGERAGLLSTEEAGTDIRVRLGHPLFGEVIRSQTPRMRRRTVHTTLAEAAGSADGLRSEDAVRIAVWHLEAGSTPDPELLVAAAGWALAALDYRLAEQLCRTVGEAGASWPAERLLAQALVGQGKADAAEDLLSGQFAVAATDVERAEIASVQALNLYWGLNRPEQARAVLDQAATHVGGSAQCAGLDAMRGRFLLHAGRCLEVLDVLDPVLADPHVPHRVMLGAMATATMALVACGQYDDAIGLAARGLLLARPTTGEGWLLALDELASTQAIAYLWSGQFTVTARLAESGYQRALEVRSSPNVAVWALVRGQLAAARGAMTEASVWLREAIATLDRPTPLHPYQGSIARAGLDALARVAAQTADLAGVQVALAQADALAGPAIELFDTWPGPIHAWIAVARGEIPAAIRLALDAAAEARQRGQTGCELNALHDAARLGAPARAAPRAAELATVVQGDLASLFVRHIQALVAANGVVLDTIAASFAARGANLLAAEAAAEAAGAHRHSGRTASAAASAARAAALAATCGGARTPALAGLSEPVSLTSRELEIARMAASGLSSRAIADRLVVAVRTVDNALGRIYAKLCIGGRAELSSIFTSPGAALAGGSMGSSPQARPVRAVSPAR
jgi:DNA-binding CsgD family transcriptional regulator